MVSPTLREASYAHFWESLRRLGGALAYPNKTVLPTLLFPNIFYPKIRKSIKGCPKQNISLVRDAWQFWQRSKSSQ